MLGIKVVPVAVYPMPWLSTTEYIVLQGIAVQTPRLKSSQGICHVLSVVDGENMSRMVS